MVEFHVWDNISGEPRIERSLVPCGRCPCCLASVSSEWQTRLKIEYDNALTAYFVTLTYDDASLPFVCSTDSFGDKHYVQSVCKKHIQDFIKRLRYYFPNEEIRYFCCSEYGPTTLRPHYHLVLFNLPIFFDSSKKQIVKITQIISKIWTHGGITIDPVTPGRIAYVTKYITCKTDLPEYFPPPFRLMSKGLGKSYLNKTSRINWHRENLINYYPDGNKKLALPRYLKDKIFDDCMKIDLREKSMQFRRERMSELIARSKSLGYNDYRDYLEDQSKSFMRKFDKKMKKNRKDL